MWRRNRNFQPVRVTKLRFFDMYTFRNRKWSGEYDTHVFNTSFEEFDAFINIFVFQLEFIAR